MVRATGVILAGGASTRMGSDKALVDVGDHQMIEWVRRALVPVCPDILVAGRTDGIDGLPGVADSVGELRGPLAGLVAALEGTDDTTIVLVATDQPWIRTDTLRRMLERAGDLPVVPVGHDGTRQTTCAVYPAGILPVALDELLAGGSIQSVLDRTAFDAVDEDTWRSWGEDGRSWFSVDTAEALDEGLDRFGIPD